MSLWLIMSMASLPECKQKTRQHVSALAWCLVPHNDFGDADLGHSTGAAAAQLAATVFGREEENSQFKFCQAHIDAMVMRWSEIIQGLRRIAKPSQDNILVKELVISDVNKELLLENPAFIPCETPSVEQEY